MSGRLGGASRKPINHVESVSDLHIHTIPTMSQALELSRRQFWAAHSRDDSIIANRIGNKPVDGDKARLQKAFDHSEQLIADAILEDQRLARRAQWLRRDEGEHVDSGLLAAGDDQPFYKYTRRVVNEATLAGEPVRIVVSTDDNKVPEGTAAAFIACARLVQQFVPLEIWWQGAWLNETRTKGFIFHVPLVQGDMDFSRLEFCIADDQRDMFSYRVMATHAVLDIKESWNSCGYRAEQHYLMGKEVMHRDGRQRLRAHFVAHDGIRPEGDCIAWEAARWIGWDAAYTQKWDEEAISKSAEQSLPEEPKPRDYRGMDSDTRRTLADIRRRDKEKAQSRLEK